MTLTIGRTGADLDKKVKVIWEQSPACIMRRNGSYEELGKEQSRQSSYGLVAYFIHLLCKSVRSTRSATLLANSLL